MVSISEQLVRWLCILLVGFIFSSTLITDPLSSSGYLLINQGLFITLISYSLLTVPKNYRHLLSNSIATVLLTLLLSELILFRWVPIDILTRMAMVVFCLALFLWSLTQLTKTIFPTMLNYRLPIILLMTIICSIPVWLGPWVDLNLPDNQVINTIISMTPVTHFSVAVEYDYLRSEWFYRNTPFGSLPFIYPDLSHIVSGYLALILFLQVILWKIRYKST